MPIAALGQHLGRNPDPFAAVTRSACAQFLMLSETHNWVLAAALIYRRGYFTSVINPHSLLSLHWKV